MVLFGQAFIYFIISGELRHVFFKSHSCMGVVSFIVLQNLLVQVIFRNDLEKNMVIVVKYLYEMSRENPNVPYKSVQQMLPLLASQGLTQHILQVPGADGATFYRISICTDVPQLFYCISYNHVVDLFNELIMY